MLNYKSFTENRQHKRDDIFYVKIIKKSKSGQSTLIGFELKNIKAELWVYTKSIYKIMDHDLPKLSNDYKKIILPSFLYTSTDEDKALFFKQYDQHLLPIINKLESLKDNERNENLLKTFNKHINRIIKLDAELIDNEFITNIGKFKIEKHNPLTVRINNLSLILDDEINVYYKDKLFTGLGKDGLIIKLLIKQDFNISLNSIEKMNLRKIIQERESVQDKEYMYSDDKTVYNRGKQEAELINILKNLL